MAEPIDYCGDCHEAEAGPFGCTKCGVPMCTGCENESALNGCDDPMCAECRRKDEP